MVLFFLIDGFVDFLLFPLGSIFKLPVAQLTTSKMTLQTRTHRTRPGRHRSKEGDHLFLPYDNPRLLDLEILISD